jgi:DMSO/TMAO reductase YedYZ molybdopterin-dependent catalytic subunit
MEGVSAAAQRKADKLSSADAADGAADGQADASGTKKAASTADATAAMSSRNEAEDLRAGVIARHRQEWVQVAGLRQEALLKRPKKTTSGAPIPGSGSVAEAFEAAKLAKITAEMTAIQQAGERKAWGLDVVVDPEQMKNLSDEDLKAMAEGKAPRR